MRDDLIQLGTWCSVVIDVDLAVHEDALRLAEQHQLPFYDACIAAAALRAGCDRLLSEDFHHGLVVDERLTVENPFR